MQLGLLATREAQRQLHKQKEQKNPATKGICLMQQGRVC